MEKQTLTIFGKKNYLLGTDQNGRKLFLVAPSWDCGWYWGFGYIETYTNNRHPERSKDIASHNHFDSLFGNKNCATPNAIIIVPIVNCNSSNICFFKINFLLIFFLSIITP